jgi:hypothetical protein
VQQARLLMAAEFTLLQVELRESAAVFVSALGRAAAGAVMLHAGAIMLLVAIGFFLVRLGLPEDLAFFVVALVVMVGGLLLVRMGAAALKGSELAPKRSIAQISSIMKGL